jgi:GNAT superfamily N-acetyltransferase
MTSEATRSLTIRPVGAADAQTVQRLLETAPRSHLHPDWRPITDWLDRAPAFAVESPFGMAGCLLASIDPAPASWIRAAAVAGGFSPGVVMRQLFAPCLDALANQGVETLAGMPTEPWLAPILDDLGFAIVEQVETWRKPDLIAPRSGAPDLIIRPALNADLAELARIDHLAFPPRWRFSVETLRLAWEQAAVFTVAEREDRTLGFQISLSDRFGAHLARLTVHPQAQGCGVGSRLLADALEQYALLNLTSVSLNTQTHNTLSHRLYTAFAFEPLSPPLPVWERPV